VNDDYILDILFVLIIAAIAALLVATIDQAFP